MPAHRRPRLFHRHTPTTPTPTRYTMTGYLNPATGPHGWPENYYGYQPWHRLVEAGDPALPGLPLRFTIAAPNPRAAATLGRAIGHGRATDLHLSSWPTALRRLAVGDVIAIADPNAQTGPRYFALAPEDALTEMPCINEPLQLSQVLFPAAT